MITKDSETTLVLFSSLDRVLENVEYVVMNYRPVLNGEHYLTGDEVCRRLCISKRTLQDYRDTGLLGYQYNSKNTTQYTYAAGSLQPKTVVQFGNEDTANKWRIDYAYNNRWQLTGILRDSTDYSFTYDLFGNLMKTMIGSRTLSTNTYGARNGKLMKETYGNGDIVSTDYDNLDRAVNRKANGKVQYSWAYDGEGNIGRLEDQVNGVTHRYEYDTTGRLQRETGSDGRELYYKYDVNNNVTGQSYTMDGETRTMSHEIGEDNILTGSTLDGDVQVTKTYDGLNRLTRKDAKLGTSNPNVRYAYTNGSRTNETTTQVGVESHYMGAELRDEYSYEYDELGNITEALQAGMRMCNYEYDSVGELTRVDDGYAGKTTVYTYDKAGNILKKTEYPYKNLTSATKVVNYTYGDSGWKDLLTAYNGKTIRYDGIGNPIQTTHGEKYWWTGRQLDKMMTDVGRELAFKYSEDGIRTEKRDSRGEIHEYLLEGSRILRERIVDDETGSVLHTLWYDYDGNGGLTSVEYDGEKYLYKRNMQGDILGLYNVPEGEPEEAE